MMEDRGISNLIANDLKNIQQQFCRDGSDEMWNFIKNLELTGHHVRWLADEDNRICCVFFAHKHGVEEARRLPECVVVDATYKTNSHKMVLLNFVVAGTLRSNERPKQLVTVPIAGCWMDRETKDRYCWAMGNFRDVVWPADTDKSFLPKCFVTDNDEALQSALKTVFSESKLLLCYLHIQRNFALRLKQYLSSDIKKDGNWFYYSNYFQCII